MSIESGAIPTKNPWEKGFALALLAFALLLAGLFAWRNSGHGLQVQAESGRAQTEPIGAAMSFPLDLNEATPEQLQMLPGIGPVLAERIAAAREDKGGFAAIEELLEIEGIGEKTLEGIRAYVTVEGTE